MAQVRIESEAEARTGWTFRVQIERARGSTTHDVTLSWVDYEHWSHGSVAPERVTRAVLEALLELQPDRDLPARFDAATARRWCHELDRHVRPRI